MGASLSTRDQMMGGFGFPRTSHCSSALEPSRTVMVDWPLGTLIVGGTKRDTRREQFYTGFSASKEYSWDASDGITPTALNSKGFRLTHCIPSMNILSMQIILQGLELQGTKEDSSLSNSVSQYQCQGPVVLDPGSHPSVCKMLSSCRDSIKEHQRQKPLWSISQFLVSEFVKWNCSLLAKIRSHICWGM